MDKEFQQQIEKFKNESQEKMGMLGVWRFTLEDVLTGKTEIHYYKNVITTVGRAVIANNLTSPTPTHPMLINYASLGTNATTAVIADTQLGTETYRNSIISRTNASNVAYATAFFSQTEVTGTFLEAGIWMDATATANSGVILSHVNINVTKTNTQKLTIDWTLTLLSA